MIIKNPVILTAVVFFFSLTPALGQQAHWRVTKSEHFIVYYKNADDMFIDRLIDNAEDHYNEIADNLGFRRFNFWLWENRAKIYIWDNAEDYQKETGQKAWSAGSAIVKDKIIRTYVNASGFFQGVLPHEMGHIIFREFVGFDNPSVPLWLDEGVACFQEFSRRAVVVRIIDEAIKNKKLMRLAELSVFKPQESVDTDKVGLFYAECLSLVESLIKGFGRDRFVLFCQNLRDKRDFDSALRVSFSLNNTQDLEKYWLDSLED